MPIQYAAYGSNLHPLRLERRTGAARLLGTASAKDLALRFHKRGSWDGSGKCNVIERTGSHVYMAIFEIPDSGVEDLDVAEGVGSGYEQEWIEIDGYGRCLTYRAEDTHIDDDLFPFTWYRELVLAGCRVHDFPEDYVQAIESVESVIDPDPERHAFHMQLLQALNGSSEQKPEQ